MRRSVSLLAVTVLTAGAAVAVAVLDSSASATPPAAVAGVPLGWGLNTSGQLGLGTATNNPTATPPGLPTGTLVTSVSPGATHTLALASNGTVYAWGDNTYGELGNGNGTSSKTPVQVNIPAGVTITAVSAGYYDSAALTSTGAVYTWGLDNTGQLGNATTNATVNSAPVLASIPAGNTITQISVGYAQVLALTSTGSVYAWGYNATDQLGDGTTTTRNAPVLVHLPAGVVAAYVSAGYGHSVAVTSTGTAYAWGANNRGQLGDGTATQRTVPTAVGLGALRLTAVAAGFDSTVGLTTAGGVVVWGDNTFGELGNSAAVGTPALIGTPSPVNLGGATATAIAAGLVTNYALTSTGSVFSWGDNSVDELGSGATTPASTGTPTAVKLPVGAVATAVSSSTYSENGYVLAPQVADTTTITGSGTPTAAGTPVTYSASVTAVDGGGTFSFTADGSAIAGCTALTPKLASANTYTASCGTSLLAPGNHPIVATYSGDVQYQGSSATLAGGQTVTAVAGVEADWGYNATGQLGNGGSTASRTPIAPSLPAGTTVVAEASDSVHSAAITSAGAVYTWGDNTYGELGNGTNTASSTPVAVTLPAGVTATQVATGYYTTLVLGNNGRVYAWGLNNTGQLGNNTVTNSNVPVQVLTPAGVIVIQISSGYAHEAAVTSTGAIYTWGYDATGQLGIGSTTAKAIPTLVTLPAGTVATSVSAGYSHTLATTFTGSVLAWGDNSKGELGNGTTTQANSPTTVPLAAASAVGVSAGGYDSYAVLADGSIRSWGANTYGELGNGTTTDSSSPVTVTLPAQVTASKVVAGTADGYALTSAGLLAWGDNSFGELGNGATASSSTPVAVSAPSGGTVTGVGSGPYSLTAALIAPQITSVTTVSSAPNPSTYGQTVTITATVAPVDGGGTVAFTADGSLTPIPGCAATTLTLTGGTHTATCTISTLDAGNHSIAATYSGDAFYGGSSATLTGGQTVAQAMTTTTLTTSATTLTQGSPVTFTATVAPTDGGGSVAFFADGSATPITGCETEALTATAGVYTATCTTSALTGGAHTITAAYTGDTDYAPSNGALAGTVTVQIATVLTVANVTSLNGLGNINVKYSATLTTSDGTPIAGAQLSFQTTPLPGFTPEKPCLATTDANGVATCNVIISALLTKYTVSYAGSALYLPSSGAGTVKLI